MCYYFLANIKINDPQLYQNYINKVDEVFKKFKDKFLAVDDNPKLVDGRRDYSRAIIIEFETEEDFYDVIIQMITKKY